MIIFCQAFTSLEWNENPAHLRQEAIMYANKVNESGDVINISEVGARWGNSVTVWYKAMRKVEV